MLGETDPPISPEAGASANARKPCSTSPQPSAMIAAHTTCAPSRSRRTEGAIAAKAGAVHAATIDIAHRSIDATSVLVEQLVYFGIDHFVDAGWDQIL